jgi:hypothetical protein
MKNCMKNIVIGMVFSFVIACNSKESNEKKLIAQNAVNEQQTKVINNFTTDSLLAEMVSPIQEFELDANKDIWVTGKEGTRVFIPAKSLVNKNGKRIKGNVKLSLKEAYKIENFVGENLSTYTKDNQLLESAGMVCVQVKQGNDVLMMRSKASYKVYLPNKDSSSKMDFKLFYQVKNNDGMIEWKKASTTKTIQLTIISDYTKRLEKVQTGNYFENIYYSLRIEKNKRRYWKIVSNDNLLNEELKKQFDDIDDIRYLLGEQDSFMTWKVKLIVNEDNSIEDIKINETKLSLLDNYILDKVKKCKRVLNFKKLHPLNLKDSTQWFTFSDFGKNREHLEKKLNIYKIRIKSYKDLKENKLDNDIVNEYVLSVTKFDWINCDRFYNSTTPLITQNITSPDSNVRIVVIFEKINSVLQVQPHLINAQISNIPINEPIKIIAFKTIEGMPYKSELITTTQNSNIVLPSLTLCKLEDIKNTFQ